MGRKRQAKLMRRLFEEAQRLEVQQAKKPCETCAFKDPSCGVADQAIWRKVRHCLKTGNYFYCHDGMSLGGEEGKAYQPPLRPDGSVDRAKMEPCGGFIRFAAKVRELPAAEQDRELMRLQRHFLTRYLQSEQCYQGFKDLTVNDLQYAINLSAYFSGDDDEEHLSDAHPETDTSIPSILPPVSGD